MENKFNKFIFIAADDHTVVTKSVSFILKELYKDAIVYEIGNIADIVKRLHDTDVNLIMLDVSFPDGDTLSIVPNLKKIQPNLKILIFSGHDEDIYALRYLQVGANGYLNKLSSEDEIKYAINSIINTGKYLSKNVQEKLMDNYIFKKPSNPLEQLSNRELEIARLMVDGYGNIEICLALDLQKSTVSTYKTRIFEKLEIETLADLIQLFTLYKEV